MIACKILCMSRMYHELDVQMGAPEPGTPGQTWIADGESTGGQTQVSRARAQSVVRQAMAVAGAPSASRPSLPRGGPQLPGSVSTGGGCTADLGVKCCQPLGALLHP